MLPKSHRLTKTKDIMNVTRKGFKYNTKNFTISVLRNQNQIDFPVKENKQILSQYKDGVFIGTHVEIKNKPEPKIEPTGKLCIIISTKYGKANKRNLLRRRIRCILSDFVMTSDLSIVIQIKKGAKLLEFEEVQNELVIINNLQK